MASVAECAAHLGMNTRNFYDLISRGIIERRAGRRAYDLDAVRLAYIEHLRTVAAGRQNEDDPEDAKTSAAYEAERARRMAARADIDEMERDRLRDELIPAAQVADAITEAITVLKQRLLAIPTKLAGQVAAARKPDEAERLISDEIKEALEEVSKLEVIGPQ